jgi:hypothetical protein
VSSNGSTQRVFSPASTANQDRPPPLRPIDGRTHLGDRAARDEDCRAPDQGAVCPPGYLTCAQIIRPVAQHGRGRRVQQAHVRFNRNFPALARPCNRAATGFGAGAGHRAGRLAVG